MPHTKSQVDVLSSNGKSIVGKKVAALMGRKVVVLKEMHRSFVPALVEDLWQEDAFIRTEPRSGWIIGARRVYDGKTITVDFDSPCEFQATNNHAVLLVAYWPTEKPVCVIPVDKSIRFWVEGEDEPFSSSFGHTKSARDQLRKYMSDEVQDSNCYPRDKAGRFRKQTTEELHAEVMSIPTTQEKLR